MARVFISYSHDSDAHRQAVLDLAHALLAVGHEVVLDRFTPAPVDGWPRWMVRQVREAERIVCVCTATYRRRFEGDETTGGLGVSWEGHLLTTDLYLNRGRTERVVPVFVTSVEDVPFALRAHEPLQLADREALIARLGGTVGPAQLPPPLTVGIDVALALGRLLDPIFKAPRPYAGVKGYLPSQLLRPEHAVVPFMGREEVVVDLDEWCAGGGARVRVLHGPGGVGKTRLALQVAAHRAGEGWRAGPLAWRNLSDETLDELFRDPIPLFLIVDYAETRPAEVTQILRRLADHRDTASARVLLLARGMGEWWSNLQAEVPDVEGLAWGFAPVHVDEVEQGADHARAAADAFAGWQGRPVPRDVPDRGRTALDRQVEALVAVMGGDVAGIAGFLRHEDAYLGRAAKAAGVPEVRRRLLPKVMALYTLVDGVGPEEAGDWARAVRGLGDMGEGDAALVTDLLAALYRRGEGGVDGMRPDRVGEALVVREDADGKLAEVAVDRGRGKEALTVLTRLGAAGDERPLRRLIEARREVLVDEVIAVAQETGDPVGRVLAESLEGRPDVSLATEFDRRLPVSSVALRELAVVAGRRLAGPDAGDDEGRASRLNDLSVRLSHVGRREEALAANEGAVAIRRRLAAARPEAILPGLAMSLSNLSNRLADLGRHEEALAASDEAVQTYRRLGGGSRPLLLVDLALSLCNRSNRFFTLGRHEEALTDVEEAAEVYRRLAGFSPDLFLPDFAKSLSALANCLGALDRREEALAAVEEAAAVYRRLAAARPDAFLPDLGMSLNNLSVHLSNLGRREESLAAIEEALEVYRRLAAARPDAFLPGLAGLLNNHSACLSDLGRREEAVAAIEGSVELYRRLAAARPDVFLPGLAISLAGRAMTLTGADVDVAVASAAESLGYFNALAERLPAAFTARREAVREIYKRACTAAGVEPDPALLAGE